MQAAIEPSKLLAQCSRRDSAPVFFPTLCSSEIFELESHGRRLAAPRLEEDF